MSEPVQLIQAGPSWKAIAGWGGGTIAFLLTIIGGILRFSFGWIPGRVDQHTAILTAVQGNLENANKEIERLRNASDGNTVAVEIASIKQQITGLSSAVEKLDGKFGRLLESMGKE